MLHTIRSHARQIILSLLGSALAVAFMLLVWPTPYRYTTIHTADATLPVRISRVTGAAEFLYVNGWQRMGRAPDVFDLVNRPANSSARPARTPAFDSAWAANPAADTGKRP